MFSRTEDLPADWEPTTTWIIRVSLGRQESIRRMKNAYNLRKIQGITADGVEDKILQLVDGAEQILAEGSHGDGGKERRPEQADADDRRNKDLKLEPRSSRVQQTRTRHNTDEKL